MIAPFVLRVHFVDRVYVFTGSVPAVIPGGVRRVTQALHCPGSGHVCTRDAGQHPHRFPVRLPPGGRQVTLYRQNRGERAVHQPGYTQSETCI